MEAKRMTRQREAIFAQLVSRSDHPTAEEIHEALKPDWPRMSLATVYRNLGQLCEGGRAQKLGRGAADRFDGNAAPHCHLTCERCGGVFDLPTPPADTEAEPQAAANYPGKITGHTLCFFGLCPNCLNRAADDRASDNTYL